VRRGTCQASSDKGIEAEKKPMKRKITVLALSAMLSAALCASAQAQQPAEKVHRVGILSGASDVPQFFEAFRQRLRDLGHVEGKNIFFEHRYAAGDLDRLPDYAAQLINEKVDAIVAVTIPAVLTAKKATTTIPIIMHNVPDPVGVGLVDSLASPGGNISGTSSLGVDLSGSGSHRPSEHRIENALHILAFVHPAEAQQPPECLDDIGSRTDFECRGEVTGDTR
jgi:hypothetical protein